MIPAAWTVAGTLATVLAAPAFILISGWLMYQAQRFRRRRWPDLDDMARRDAEAAARAWDAVISKLVDASGDQSRRIAAIEDNQAKILRALRRRGFTDSTLPPGGTR